MLPSLATAITGLRNHQTMMDVLSSNIANINTTGFKAQRVAFEDLMSQTLRPAGAPSATLGSTNTLQIGLGSGLAAIQNQMVQGSLQLTSNVLDMSIQGEGFFRTTTDLVGFTGVEYTRAGNFELDANGRMVTSDGQFVVGYTTDAFGNPTAVQQALTVPVNTRSLNINRNGRVQAIDNAGVVTEVGYVSLSKFPNPMGLERTQNNRWGSTSASGVPVNATANTNALGAISSGTLEMSNVDVAREFSDMILAQRGLQANSRVITTDDDILNTLVNMKR